MWCTRTRRSWMRLTTMAVAMLLAGGCDARRGTGVRDGESHPREQALPDDQALKHACFGDDPSQCPAYRAVLEAMCERGDVEGCGRLAHLVAIGTGGPQDDVRARALATDACAAGSLFGCSNLVVFAMNGQGGPRDLDEAYRAGLVACRGKHLGTVGCRNLSLVLHKEDFVLDETARTAALILACDGFAVRSCETLDSYLATLHVEGRLADDAYPLFRAVSLRTCQFGWGVSCSNLAYLFRNGIGGSRDDELVARADRRACHLGEAGNCAAGEAPRDAHVRAWPQLVIATDGGDHLDRLNALEDAWSPCSSEPGEDREVYVEVELAPGRVPVLRAEGPDPLVECFHSRFPWRDGDPHPPSADVTLHIEYVLNTPEDP